MNRIKDLWNKLFSDSITVPPLLASPYYPALDGLRGIAILIVITVHFGINHFLWRHNLSLHSNTGVNIFFVLSGFLITTLLLKEKTDTGNINLKHFYTRRMLRIMPVACLFLVVLVPLNFLFHLKITPVDFASALLFIKNLPFRNDPYTAHFWTLAVEVQFYLIFPALLTYSIKKYIITAFCIITIIPAIAIAGYYQVSFLYSNPAVALITKLMMFAFWKGPLTIMVGSFFSILLLKGIIDIKRIRHTYYMGFILLLTAILISAPKFIFYTKYVSEYLAAILIGFAIVFSFDKKCLLAITLNNRIVVNVGILSYSLYIWQELFTGTMAWQPWVNPLKAWPIGGLIILKFVCVFLIAYLSYKFVESKFLKRKLRLK